MNKKKKNIIIISIIISVVLIIIGAIFLVIGYNTDNTSQIAMEQDDGISRLDLLNNKIIEKADYKIKFTLNDENYKTISKKGDQAIIEIVDGGNKKTYTIKNGSTYLKTDDSEEYQYKNNISLLNDFENNLKNVLSKKYTVGTEEINNKNYRYEEFVKTSAFAINYKGYIDVTESRTRFYFDGNDLKYIKTYIGDISQLLKIDIEF